MNPATLKSLMEASPHSFNDNVEHRTDMLSLAAVLWLMAFALFGIRLAPILLGPAKSNRS